VGVTVGHAVAVGTGVAVAVGIRVGTAVGVGTGEYVGYGVDVGMASTVCRTMTCTVASKSGALDDGSGPAHAVAARMARAEIVIAKPRLTWPASLVAEVTDSIDVWIGCNGAGTSRDW
jgi:hypothetical protein